MLHGAGEHRAFRFRAEQLEIGEDVVGFDKTSRDPGTPVCVLLDLVQTLQELCEQLLSRKQPFWGPRDVWFTSSAASTEHSRLRTGQDSASLKVPKKIHV